MMHDLMEGLYITALGMGVVFIGLVLLAVAVRVTDLILNPRRARWPAAGGVVPAARAVAPAPARTAGAVDDELVAAITACMACVVDERGAGEVRHVGLTASLVAAITAAIVAREEAGGGPGAGYMSIRVQKGALG